MTYPVPNPDLARNRRDTRIDVLRALALLTIFIDHVPGNTLDTLTYKNFGFSDAAEGFVLISGISVALAYGGRFMAGDRLASTLKLWRRAGVLYVAHIAVTMAAIALFCFGATVAVAVTGIAGPGGGSAEKPVGLVYIAAARAPGDIIVKEHRFGDIGRDAIRMATLREALNLLRERLGINSSPA